MTADRPLPAPALLTRRRALALASAAPLASCAAVPDFEGSLDTDGRLKRAILGRHDPLSSSWRGAVLGKLPADQSADALQRQLALQRALSRSPLVTGNAATILRDGSQALPATFDAMRGARDHINLEFFIFSDVACDGVPLSDVLSERMRHGVAVNIIYDAFGSASTPPALFDTLRAAGARIVVFNPFDPLLAKTEWSPNHRDHRKILVVDGRIGFTGGINLDKVYENPPSAGVPADGDAEYAHWRDDAVRIEGPVMAELQKVFFVTWTQQKGPPVAPARYYPPLPRAGVQTIRIIASSPGDHQPLYYISLMTAVLSATRRVWLSSGYFVPPHQEREALAKTARAGVDVRIITPSHSDVQAAVYAARAAYGDSAGGGREDLRGRKRGVALEAGGHRWGVERNRFVQPRPPQRRV